ncbi:putative major tail protein [Edwardsiella phage eiAU-183]|uniref:Putative major tail protein n=4 Tax=Viruses TaxID=10239 RepID=W0LM60_9CAUD|nr:major tail protein [Edwardsiella phage eiAU-183]YP_009613901.1 major tail protein [Edwardsiella phage eiAU]ADV36473.1 putative major tail protein [Edwardsiella phage eiDWF]ADV36522.1 putative major tail protein [Edwardsiella phage eiMSLS]AHG23467.1 putative major tail protein [Edwardsiella phage eiAU]AHG23521.1 putative major tail protein [Edwardsiella phage eiAU-183]
MGYQLPNGSSVQMGATLSDPIKVIGATNAAECVFTYDESSSVAGAAVKKGDTVMLTKSPWTQALNLCGIVKAVDTAQKTITMLKLDTTDTTYYPASAFSPSVPGEMVKISGFVDFPYITNVATSGGDQQTVSFQPLQSKQAINLNTFKNPIVNTYTLTHDIEDPIRPVLEKADQTQAFAAIKFINPAAAGGKGEIRLYAAKVSFQPIPSSEVNNVETVSVALSMQSGMRIYIKSEVDAL